MTDGVSESHCAPAKYVVNLYLYYVGSEKCCNKSHTYALYSQIVSTSGHLIWLNKENA